MLILCHAFDMISVYRSPQTTEWDKSL